MSISSLCVTGLKPAQTAAFLRSTTMASLCRQAELSCDDVYSTHDIRRVIAGSYTAFSNMDVLFDPYGDLPALWGFDPGKGTALQLDHHRRSIHIGGTVYILSDGTKVIAPDDWP